MTENNRALVRNRVFWPAVVGAAVIGMILVGLATRWGAYLGDDSYYYIQPAQAALAGEGFSPSTFFGPGLPVVMLALGGLGVDLVAGIRFLNIFLFGLNLVLVGLILRKMGLRLGFILWGMLLIAVVDVFIEAHGHAMSEPLYLTFALAAILTLLIYFDRQHWGWLVGSALLAGAANLTRYAALPLVPTIALTLFLFDCDRSDGSKYPFWRRILLALGYGLGAILPLAAYLFRNRLVSGRLTRYESFSIPPLARDRIRWFLYNIESWFVPGRFLKGREFLAGLLILGVLFVAGGLFWGFHRKRIQEGNVKFLSKGMSIWALFIFFNVLMLYLVRGLEGLAPYNGRYLMPVLLSLIVILAFLLDRAWRPAYPVFKVLIAVFCFLFLLYYGYRGQDFVRKMYQSGMGFSNIGWQQSETIPFLEAHPDQGIVATGEMGIYFWTGEKPPPIVTYGSIPGLHAHLCQSGDWLVIMKQMPTEIYGYPYTDVVDGLSLVAELNDSEIYRCPE
jgi:hypothetical protein